MCPIVLFFTLYVPKFKAFFLYFLDLHNLFLPRSKCELFLFPTVSSPYDKMFIFLSISISIYSE